MARGFFAFCKLSGKAIRTARPLLRLGCVSVHKDQNFNAMIENSRQKLIRKPMARRSKTLTSGSIIHTPADIGRIRFVYL